MFFQAGPPLFVILIAVAIFFGLFVLLPVSLVATAFGKLGLSGVQGLVVFMATLMGSSVNLPLHRGTRLVRGPSDGRGAPASSIFRFSGNIGRVRFGNSAEDSLLLSEQIVAVNVGGCIVPCLLSAWFLWQMHLAGQLGGWLVLAVVISSLACYLLAKPMPGIGIGVPVLLPPAVAALTAILLAPEFPGQETVAPRTAYMAGTLGTLIGADLLHLANRRTWALLDAPLLSIGGAGTFDGIFLAGIIAVLLA